MVEALQQNDGAAFSEMMKVPLERLELLHKGENYYDDRTVQLFRDALTWGMAHPKQLMEGGVAHYMRRRHSSHHTDCGYAAYPPRADQHTGREVYFTTAEHRVS